MLSFVAPPDRPNPHLLVGHETHDDAGVYWLNEAQALVQTIDFFTPVVDDPEIFGRIAATNSLSDIYAMGGRPLTALNLLAVPADTLEPAVVAAMLQGGNAVMAAAGTALLGGHSIDDPEPKIGYAVTGLVDPRHIWRNSTARPGDRLFLTKPVGTGVVIKAIKDGLATEEQIDAAVAMMTTLNRDARDAIATVGDPSACTDVTGFGLLGHAWEMAESAGVAVVVTADAVPLLTGAYDLARRDLFPTGSRKNLAYVRPHAEIRQADAATVGLLADAVTSGGLLFTVPEHQATAIESAFRAAHLPLYAIGRVESGPARLVIV